MKRDEQTRAPGLAPAPLQSSIISSPPTPLSPHHLHFQNKIQQNTSTLRIRLRRACVRVRVMNFLSAPWRACRLQQPAAVSRATAHTALAQFQAVLEQWHRLQAPAPLPRERPNAGQSGGGACSARRCCGVQVLSAKPTCWLQEVVTGRKPCTPVEHVGDAVGLSVRQVLAHGIGELAVQLRPDAARSAWEMSASTRTLAHEEQREPLIPRLNFVTKGLQSG
jgi:hypothetical protein